MQNNPLEYIILYIMVAGVSLAIATLARIVALSLDADSFTAFVVFILTLLVLAVVYLSIRLVIQDFMLPSIEKLPFFKNNNKVTSNSLNLDEIRKNNNRNTGKELEYAIRYTQTTFASYATDEDILHLCEYIGFFANKQKLTNIKPITINDQLLSFDLYHFGWNIWNHFRIRKQDDIALLLKLAFANTLRDVEVETIKKHLKDDERRGIIKISENIVEQ
ncbi:MAG: mobilization protein [Bacteroidales bacterium]